MKIVKVILPILVLLLLATNVLAVELKTPDFAAVATKAGFSVGQTQSLPETIGLIIKVILGFLGIVLVVLIIYAGFLWMTAGGEPKNVATAQSYIKNAIMGLVIILLAYAITDFVIDKLQTEIIGNAQ
ncbi:hypothetical protein HY932_02170 [Candidatus Falkowbacteria bacterium]|nr:hypothetical protein [Candidatus Falkowbacteria bacterium]